MINEAISMTKEQILNQIRKFRVAISRLEAKFFKKVVDERVKDIASKCEKMNLDYTIYTDGDTMKVRITERVYPTEAIRYEGPISGFQA